MGSTKLALCATGEHEYKLIANPKIVALRQCIHCRQVDSGFPATDIGLCAYYKMLDREFHEVTHSPLHHNQRCPIHGSDPARFRREDSTH